jgi:hypothetical protein
VTPDPGAAPLESFLTPITSGMRRVPDAERHDLPIEVRRRLAERLRELDDARCRAAAEASYYYLRGA